MTATRSSAETRTKPGRLGVGGLFFGLGDRFLLAIADRKIFANLVLGPIKPLLCSLVGTAYKIATGDRASPMMRRGRARSRTDAEQAGGAVCGRALDTQPGRAPGCYSTRVSTGAQVENGCRTSRRRGLREGLDTQPGRAPGCYSTRVSTGAQVENGCRTSRRRGLREGLDTQPGRAPGCYSTRGSTGAQVENGCRTSRRRGLREGLDTQPGRAPGCYSTRGSTGAQVENGCGTSRRRGLREGLDTQPGRAPGCYSTRGFDRRAG